MRVHLRSSQRARAEAVITRTLGVNLTHIERTLPEMDAPQRETAIIMGLMAGCSAAITAFCIGYVAHYDFGFSREEIRVPAVRSGPASLPS